MASVVDVARCILNKCGSLSTMKLQKLVYYSQAYHLVKYGSPLFDDAIEAWANGPVVRSLFKLHQGKFVISKGYFDDRPSTELDAQALNVINHIVERLGVYSGAELSSLTHSEAPWANARIGLSPSQRSDNVISVVEMREYYSNPSCCNPAFA